MSEHKKNDTNQHTCYYLDQLREKHKTRKTQEETQNQENKKKKRPGTLPQLVGGGNYNSFTFTLLTTGTVSEKMGQGGFELPTGRMNMYASVHSGLKAQFSYSDLRCLAQAMTQLTVLPLFFHLSSHLSLYIFLSAVTATVLTYNKGFLHFYLVKSCSTMPGRTKGLLVRVLLNHVNKICYTVYLIKDLLQVSTVCDFMD